jgi:hypothetical protein
MKVSALVIAAVAQVATAHYFFDTNIVNGAPQPAFKYVRQSSRQTKYNPIKFSSNPKADIRDGSTADGPDIVCNQGGAKAGNTQVMTVNAGDEVKFKLAVGAKFQHPGPALVYMSKAPGSVTSYDGSGDWFKIFQEGLCGSELKDSNWCTWNRDYVTAKIPKDTPNGEYLVRAEHIGVHRSHVNQPEHYVSCMQVKVQGGGSGKPGPTVKFPGAYKATDAYANFSIYNGNKAFPMPGPAVWSGGAGGSSAAQPTKEASVPTTLATVTKPAATAAPAAPATGCAAQWAQCGGIGFSGATCCAANLTCNKVNDYYSQCK